MMMRRIQLSPREWALTWSTLMIAILVVAYLIVVLPQIQRLRQSMLQAELLGQEVAELERDMAIKDKVATLYAQADIMPLEQGQSDYIVISNLLREIDRIRATYSSIVLGNVRPLPVEADEASLIREYPVRITMTGKLPEMIDLITTITHHPKLIRLDSFSLQGTQGVNQVECTLNIRMIGLGSREPLGTVATEQVAEALSDGEQY